ncbi:MAG: urease accessory protein UreE [Pseudomonadales bacterium]|jgi:urease accessory protein|nr:urease accessory protein UreE [Pseudomonadales bacterium]
MAYLIISDLAEANAIPQATLTLPFELRQKARFKSKLDDGREVGLFLERGNTLQHGDLLEAEDGTVIQVRTAAEKVTQAETGSPLLIARLCFHLGNRHVPLQISETWLRYRIDHVLDQLVESLGGRISHLSAPFEPEPGAYEQPAHQYAQLHGHTHVVEND